jgi:hypothetical protein
MIFIVRLLDGESAPTGLDVLTRRPTPSYVPAPRGTDLFCVASPETREGLADRKLRIVELADGWYEVGAGGVAVWDHGREWELRDTPHTVTTLAR